MKDRLKNRQLRERVITAKEAASYIENSMVVATSGFTPSGYPKAVPLALGKRLEKEEDIKITLITGASVGDELDGELTRKNAISRRIPYQTNNSTRKAINNGEILFSDMHLSQLSQSINTNFLGNIDIGIVEASEITEEGYLIPTTSVGISPTIIEKAEKLIIEINTSQPLELKGIHDIYTMPNPPYRKPIPIIKPGDRIGTPYIPIDKEKVIGIVFTDIKDNVQPLGEVNENSKVMAEIFLDFIDHEVKRGRIPKKLLPLQSGVGSVGNAVLAGLLDSKYGGLQFYSEIIQDSMLELIDVGKADIVSGAAIAPTPFGLEKFYRNLNKYKEKMILRPQEISNSPEVIRRLGVIAMNTAIEVDIYGNVNSSNILGGKLMNGIGGSGDYARNSYLSVFFTESTAKSGSVSSIVPLVSHVDHTDNDVDIIITEQGMADLRGLSPRERAYSIIKNCTHPCYKDLLFDYYKKALKNPRHIPISLYEAFKWHESLESKGRMSKTAVDCLSKNKHLDEKTRKVN